MSLPANVAPLVRQFASNGFKFLFQHGDNVADVLRCRTPQVARRIDLSRLAVEPETFVAPGFTQLESDVLLRAPVRKPSDAGELIEVFVLLEHQSEPDKLMVFRVLRYVILIYERQMANWLQTHPNLRDFCFHPVLPIVFYWGARTWQELEPMAAVVHHGKLFGRQLPALEPIFLDLARIDAEDLRSEAGFIGWVLWLVQQRRLDTAGFQGVLRQVVQRLDRLPEGQRSRWKQLLWFAHAFVYHEREPGEREQCAEFIRGAVRASRQAQVIPMSKTIAEALREEGALNNKRETLLLQLRVRFKKIPEAIEAKIQATDDSQQLSTWLAEFAVARKLSDIDFKLDN
jgi:hypothetical protein